MIESQDLQDDVDSPLLLPASYKPNHCNSNNEAEETFSSQKIDDKSPAGFPAKPPNLSESQSKYRNVCSSCDSTSCSSLTQSQPACSSNNKKSRVPFQYNFHDFVKEFLPEMETTSKDSCHQLKSKSYNNVCLWEINECQKQFGQLMNEVIQSAEYIKQRALKTDERYNSIEMNLENLTMNVERKSLQIMELLQMINHWVAGVSDVVRSSFLEIKDSFKNSSKNVNYKSFLQADEFDALSDEKINAIFPNNSMTVSCQANFHEKYPEVKPFTVSVLNQEECQTLYGFQGHDIFEDVIVVHPQHGDDTDKTELQVDVDHPSLSLEVITKALSNDAYMPQNLNSSSGQDNENCPTPSQKGFWDKLKNSLPLYAQEFHLNEFDEN